MPRAPDRAMSGAVWTAEPERGNPTALRLLAWLALKVGRRATRWLLHPLALYYLLFARRPRIAARAFLARALGRPARPRDVLRNFHAFASAVHDRVFLLSGRLETFAVSTEGTAALEAILAQGRGCILLGAHLGSFEAVRALGRDVRRYTINIVMYEGTGQRMSAVLNELAPELKGRIIAPGRPETMLTIKERLEHGEIVGILGDRHFGSEKAEPCDFLGMPARFPVGPFRLALALDAPVVLFFGLYEGANRYRVCLEALPRPPEVSGERAAAAAAWMRSYVARLEHYARGAPYNWFNFYDFWDEGL
jgi:predicted LPLAT superfamily acyltransferase